MSPESTEPYARIISFLDGYEYEVLEHPAAITSEEASAVTGIPVSHGAKSLLLKTGETFTLCIVRGDNRLSPAKVRKVLGVRQIRFATPEEVVEVMGCEAGACYPFGNLIGIPMLVDETLAWSDPIAFSPGVRTKHLRMPWAAYQRAVQPRLANIVK